MLQVWGRSTSSNVMKVIWLLEEMGLPYQRHDVGGSFGKTDTPDYRRMNPTGLVPTLDDDGYILWESNAVCRYLAQAYAPGHKFFPADPKTRGRIDRWMDFQQTTLNRAMVAVFWGLVRTAPEARDMTAINAGVADSARAWSMLDDALSNTPFIEGETLTLADIVFGMHAHRWYEMPINRPHTPHLRAWYDRLLQRPPFRQHCAIALV